MNILLLAVAQLMYSISDLVQKVSMQKMGFSFALLKHPPFILTWILTFAALITQIYVLSRYELSKTMITIGVFHAMFATILGVYFLKEKVTALNGVGIGNCCCCTHKPEKII
jgi:hypothetical protein